MRFARGDRIIWTDAIVGAAIGTVVGCWRDSRIGWVMYVEPDHHDTGSRYPVNISEDKPRKLPRGFPRIKQRVDAGPRTL